MYQGTLEKPDSPPSTAIDYLKLFIWEGEHWEVPSIRAGMFSSVLIMRISLSRQVFYFMGNASLSSHEKHQDSAQPFGSWYHSVPSFIVYLEP